MTTELVKIDEDITDPKYGCEPSRRPIPMLLNYGLIPLDKPRGPTSHEVVSWVRKMLDVEKTGHSGTLDPGVSGLLPIGLGRGTKALSLLLLFPKEYVAVMRVHSSVPRSRVDSAIAEFTAKIFQRPPQRSAVKRETRIREIYELEVLEQEGNLYLLRCLCQAGTYIRKLVYDIGEVVQVGATMVELRRTKVGPLLEADGFVTFHQLNDAVFQYRAGDETRLRSLVKPIEVCTAGLKRAVIRDSAVDAICHGAKLAVPGILSISPGVAKGDIAVILSGKGELVAMGTALMGEEEITEAKKGLAFSTDRVIMEAGTYPKMWSKGGSEEAVGIDDHNNSDDNDDDVALAESL